MPPRTFKDMTPEELAELQAEFAPGSRRGAARRGFNTSSKGVARLPQQAMAANAPWRVDIGEALMLDDVQPDPLDIEAGGLDLVPASRMDVGPMQMGGTDFIAELIRNPPQTPRQPQISGSGPGGASFDGPDTPEARELIKSRDMRITTPPTDDDLLGALVSERPATMPELDAGGSIDDLIALESAGMDQEQQAALQARYAQAFPQQRMTREQALGDAGEGPTRMQGIAALIADAFTGSNNLDKLAERGAQARQARAAARIGDITAGERAEDREAQRELTNELTRARLGVTTRGQDLRAETQEESLAARRARGEQVDARIVSEGALNRGSADVRADKNLQARMGPQLSPEDQNRALAAQLAADANVSPAKALAYVAGQPTADTTPEELAKLEQFHSRQKALGPIAQQDVLKNTQKREAGTPDAVDAAAAKKKLDPEARLKLRTELGDTKASVTSAIVGWESLSPRARKVLVSVGNATDANSLLNALQKASLSGEEQAAAANTWRLVNELIKARSGAAVTNQEMVRLANEAGLPAAGWTSLVTSPQVMHNWLGKLREAAIRRRKAVQAEYDGMEGF
jgi:hypothetical protein